jgi:hypothetical protein
MESDDGESTRAAEAAEIGLKVIPKNLQLGLLAGSARLRLGKSLVSQAQNDRANQEFRKAESILTSTIANATSIDAGEYWLRSNVFRALVLTYEQLLKGTEIPKKGRTNAVRERFIGLLSDTLHTWSSEHPDDQHIKTEMQRLVGWFPELNIELQKSVKPDN